MDSNWFELLLGFGMALAALAVAGMCAVGFAFWFGGRHRP